MKTTILTHLEPIDVSTGDIHVIIETPRGHRNKYKYEPEKDLFRLNKALPAGAVFPYDFGFVPSTLGQDGDPIDVLLLMDEAAYPGTLITARLVGVIEAEQTEKEQTMRNDRLIAVAAVSEDYKNVRDIRDLPDTLLSQLEHFFVSYNAIEGRQFKPIGRGGADEAKRLLDAGCDKFDELDEQRKRKK